MTFVHLTLSRQREIAHAIACLSAFGHVFFSSLWLPLPSRPGSPLALNGSYPRIGGGSSRLVLLPRCSFKIENPNWSSPHCSHGSWHGIVSPRQNATPPPIENHRVRRPSRTWEPLCLGIYKDRPAGKPKRLRTSWHNKDRPVSDLKRDKLRTRLASGKGVQIKFVGTAGCTCRF